MTAVVLVATTGACTSERATPSPSRTSTPAVSAASGAPAACTPQQTESLLRAFVRDYNAGQDVVGTYFAGPDRFERWWDPTLPLGQDLGGTTDYPRLAPHLRDLHDQGIRLTVTGYAGQPNGNNGIGFVFGVRQGLAQAASPGPMTAKGVLDCTTNRFTILVIDWHGP